jgi:hypothetical protein
METENIYCTTSPEDITSQLANLIEAGWNEQQIARFARMRATYDAVTDEFRTGEAANVDKHRLAFASWLYRQGRLVS